MAGGGASGCGPAQPSHAGQALDQAAAGAGHHAAHRTSFHLTTLFDLKVGDGFALTALALAMCHVSDVLLDKQACQRDRACNILHKGTTVAASTDANERMT